MGGAGLGVRFGSKFSQDGVWVCDWGAGCKRTLGLRAPGLGLTLTTGECLREPQRRAGPEGGVSDTRPGRLAPGEDFNRVCKTLNDRGVLARTRSPHVITSLFPELAHCIVCLVFGVGVAAHHLIWDLVR